MWYHYAVINLCGSNVLSKICLCRVREMIKVFAFDLDGTLTQHKTPIDERNRAVLRGLAERHVPVMVGAGNCMRIHGQVR